MRRTLTINPARVSCGHAGGASSFSRPALNIAASLLCTLLMAACSPRLPLYVEVVESEMARHPEASHIDGQQGKLKWNYTTGLELKAFLDVWEMSRLASLARHDTKGARKADIVISTEEHRDFAAVISTGEHRDFAAVISTGAQRSGEIQTPSAATRARGAGRSQDIIAYVEAWYDAIIDEDGIIYKYKKSNYSQDHICPGRTLFQLYEVTGKEKYRAAMDTLYGQLRSQPRTPEGGFWHKQIYPDQMWLDGLYMAEPFYAEYTQRYVTDPDERAANFADIAQQFIIVAEHTYDPATGLYRHAWDSSHRMFWCNPATGQSDHAWGRAMGWYMMALVDVLPLLPEETPGRDRMLEIYKNLCETLPRYADPKTGMWYQVLDRPCAEGNWVEATASAMFVYAMAKGSRLGYVNEMPYAKQAYKKLKKTFVTRENGLVNLDRCCEVAGLGGKDNRRGDYDYYINEKICSNDPKGIGPLIWAALELE